MKNYFYFLAKWKEYLSSFLDVYSYCLLPNHFHFLVKVISSDNIPPSIVLIEKGDNIPLRDSISLDINSVIEEKFRRLFITYSQAINKERKRTGSLFQKRFKRILVTSDEYFIWLVHYIHHNPVHHGLTENCKYWKYSSYNAIIHKRRTGIKKKEVLDWFGSLSNFIEFHKKDINVNEVYPYGIDQ